MEKFLCIKSYSEIGNGHNSSIGHVSSGKIYISQQAFCITDNYGHESFWDEDIFNLHFKTLQSIRQDRLDLILGYYENVKVQDNVPLIHNSF